MEVNKNVLVATVVFATLLTISFAVSIVGGFGKAESAHSAASVWLYIRRMLMIAAAVLVPLITWQEGLRGFGWKVSGNWIVIAVLLGIPIGYANKGGFDPRSVTALLLAGFHAFATEFFFRAYLITAISKSFKNFWPPILVSAVMYGIFYLSVWTTWQQQGLARIAFVCLFIVLGIVFGYCYKKSKSVWVPWIMHFLGVLQYRVFF